jgi:hypothetical protein
MRKSDRLFETALVISTSHTPKSKPDFGELRTAEHEYGWVVWLSDAATKPEWICPALEYARINSCTMIVYDRDAPKVDHLQLWDW